MSPAEYAVSGGGGEAAERWQGFLKRVLPDKEVREFVQRLIGYSMSGEVTEHVLAIFTGSGQNGKGTFRDAVLAAFGDYGYETNPRILLEGASERHTTELMELRGRRLVFCSEIGRKQRLDAAVMKRLVGGDPIEARRMRADPVSFMPSHTLITMTNHLPAVDADDKALWRRLRVVPWDVEIPEAERDGLLPRKLREPEVQREIIRWAFEGWKAYQERGLEAPEAVSARTAVYRTENDLIARFLDERTLKVETKAAVIRARELYAAYVTWCNRVGEEADTETAFGKSMKLAGYEKKRTNKGWFYERLILTPDE
jgi:putative DNA primase/helicase